MLDIYTDGGCAKNGDPDSIGSTAFVIVHPKKLYSDSRLYKGVTNNQMEMRAVVDAFLFIDKMDLYGDRTFCVYSDSKYMVDGMNGRLAKLKENNDFNDTVKNFYLWNLLDIISNTVYVEWKWIRGHSGNQYNEMCDQLCTKAMSKGV